MDVGRMISIARDDYVVRSILNQSVWSDLNIHLTGPGFARVGGRRPMIPSGFSAGFTCTDGNSRTVTRLIRLDYSS